jgi:Fe2+ transport system protein FeoA
VVEECSSLAEAEPGMRVRVCQVDDASPEVLRHLGQLGLYPGAVVTVHERLPFGGHLRIEVQGREAHLGVEPADTSSWPRSNFSRGLSRASVALPVETRWGHPPLLPATGRPDPARWMADCTPEYQRIARDTNGRQQERRPTPE